MTQQAQLELEERFRILQASLNAEQWSDWQYLLGKVNEISSLDVTLAFRLMQRVVNLNPTSKNHQQLRELRNKSLKEIPTLATLTKETKGERFKQNALSLKELIVAICLHPQLTKFKRPFSIFVILPFFIFTFYQVVIASPRYESQSKLILREPDSMSTLDPAMALMTGFGISGGNSDIELVKAFIYSNDMLDYLDETINIEKHYSANEHDIFSRLARDASKEALFNFFLKMVTVELDEKSQVISVFVQAYNPDFAHLMSQSIVAHAEWYINEIGHNLAKKQLEFVKLEHSLIEQRLQKSKNDLLAFQRRHDLLDPEAEGVALQRITYELEGEIAAKSTELSALKSSMSENAPQVIQVRIQLEGMIKQLEQERSRLTNEKFEDDTLPKDERHLSVSQILAKFSDYKINMELALQAYASSQVSLEKSRIEAYRQLIYLVTVESPTKPEEAKYPKIIYNSGLFLAILLMIFGIGRIIMATVAELR